MKYTTSYTSSKGQPSNGHETHGNLNAALAAWEASLKSLLSRSGGESTLLAWGDGDSEHAAPSSSISWLEHPEGGFIIAAGDWASEIKHLAQHEQENGGELTAAKALRYLAE